MVDSLLSPSKITAWLDCGHYLTLRERLDAGLLEGELSHPGSFARLVTEKGSQHEAQCLEHFKAQRLNVYEVPARKSREPFADWVDRVGTPWDAGYDVIYQMPFVHAGIRGIADFLVKTDAEAGGCSTYEPLDAKLARTEAKPGHLLQLCFYAEALEALTGVRPAHLHLWLGSGHIESLQTKEFFPYWRRLRSQLMGLLETDLASSDSHPEPCAHCDFCEFAGVCETQWRDEDSLVYAADIRADERWELETAKVMTLADLAECPAGVASLRPQRLARLVSQAELQVGARDHPDHSPPYRVIDADEDTGWGHGLEALPEPDEGDVFLDFEGDPFWTTASGLFFLFGLIARDLGGTWVFDPRWAHDREQEQQATADLIEYLSERRKSHPNMHVYHYNHTERSVLLRLASDHGVGQAVLDEMISTGCFVDLYPVVRNSVQVGTESYGLKDLERLTGYQRSHEIDRGSAAVVEYEKYMETADAALLKPIAAYNEDDVRATRALRDWLVGLRADDLPWRESWLDPEDGHPDLASRIADLYAFGPDSDEHLLGDLLGYWLREHRANTAPKVVRTAEETSELLDDPDLIAGLTFVGLEPRFGKKGNTLTHPGARFCFPEQIIAEELCRQGVAVLYGTPDGPIGYASVDELDQDERTLLLVWNERAVELAVYPPAVALNDWVPPTPKPAALDDLAARVLDSAGCGAPNRASISLLSRDTPRFTPGGGPSGGHFSDDLEAMCQWTEQLDGSCLSIQGPPGTGKTYWGANIVHHLVGAGQRVGITAMSHHAIDNLLEEIVRVFTDAGDLDDLRAVRRVPAKPQPAQPGVTYTTTNSPCAKADFNLVAGTTWLFAGADVRAAPVDVLIVDEAGQLALSDALAASTAARNVVLLGDPLQLPQIAQAVHPAGSGASVLEHMLGDGVTLGAHRGVFLTQTRRMHPDVCRFISEEIYEGRLESHPDCSVQSTAFGTGLRWLRAEHDGRSTESIEEARLVAAQITRLLGTPWIDRHGVTNPLTAGDFMVVAPYNDQVALIRATLDLDPITRGVAVGTVDKFQGREAAVVFFTMTTSSSEHMPRGAEFLFSRNRLNVAVSRARCLAYLVCTEELLNSRARSIDDMRLISTLCSFVESSEISLDS